MCVAYSLILVIYVLLEKYCRYQIRTACCRLRNMPIVLQISDLFGVRTELHARAWILYKYRSIIFCLVRPLLSYQTGQPLTPCVRVGNLPRVLLETSFTACAAGASRVAVMYVCVCAYACMRACVHICDARMRMWCLCGAHAD